MGERSTTMSGTGKARLRPAAGRQRRGRSDLILVAALRLGFLAAVLLVWTLAARAAPSGLFASPLAVARAGWGLLVDGKLLPALQSSLTVYLIGTGAAAFLGSLLGLAMGTWRLLGRTLDVYVLALAATPRVAFIPLIIVMLGLGIEAKLLVVFLGAVMPVILNAYAGVRAADPELVEMAQATGAGRARILVHVVLPGAVPYLMTGIRIGAAIGLINTIVAELYTAISGLGGLLAVYGGRFRMAEYLAVVVVLALIGALVTEGLRLAEKRLLRWRDTEAREPMGGYR
mgnify:CR=1 FL=1